MAGVERVEARWKNVAAPVVVALGTLGAFAYVASVDPNEGGHYPTCPFLQLTGWACPGCGGLRMTHAIAHGRLGEAAGLNLLAFVLLPVAVYLWALWLRAAYAGREVHSRLANKWVIWGLAMAIIGFWIVRNLPFGAALAP